MRAPRVVGVLALLALATCRPRAPDARATVVDYGAPSSWLCLPDRHDACDIDLTATELRPGGARVVVPAAVPKSAKDATVDCFYVYPTVDLELVPGNHTNFADPRIANVAAVQAARFREACAVYAPFYRQVTIGTYLRPPADLERGLAIGFADVERAFAEYLRKRDRGRKIVLVGHSQGGEMVIRLLRRFFEHDAVLRARLLLAMPIGAGVEVPLGGGPGGAVPVCSRAEETGCIVAYHTHLEGSTVRPPRGFAPSAGHAAVCVNPAMPGSAELRPLSRTYLPVDASSRSRLRGVEDVTTPFLLVRDLYGARCEEGPNGYRYLAITPLAREPSRTVDPIDFARSFPDRGILAPLGLHILDVQLAQGDLVDMIARLARAEMDARERDHGDR